MNMCNHEGYQLKLLMRGTGKSQGDIAQDLGMSRQNLNHHLRMETLQESFKALVKEKVGIGMQELSYDRTNIATSIMQGLLSNECAMDAFTPEELAEEAVKYTDALINALKRK